MSQVDNYPERHRRDGQGRVDAEAKKEQRRKAKSKGKNPKPAEGLPKHDGDDEGEQPSKSQDDG